MSDLQPAFYFPDQIKVHIRKKILDDNGVIIFICRPVQENVAVKRDDIFARQDELFIAAHGHDPNVTNGAQSYRTPQNGRSMHPYRTAHRPIQPTRPDPRFTRR